MSAPIALFVYNRPAHTRRTVDALQKNSGSRQSDLFVFSDGPKDQSQYRAVQEVRKYISEISGFKSLHVIEREANYGLANSIIEGVSLLCQEYNRAIVLEDDLITSENFLDYMNRALEKYQDEESVMQIAGYMFPVQLKSSTDAIFLPFVNSWGWATWARAWKHFDPSAKAYSRIKEDKALRKKFEIDGCYPYFKLLKRQLEGEIDSWAIRLHLSVFMREGLTLYPVTSLIQNIGKDGSGTHFRKIPLFSINQETKKLREPVSIPIEKFPDIFVESDCFQEIKKYLNMQQSLFSKFKYLFLGE
jgi:hypothetical protein